MVFQARKWSWTRIAARMLLVPVLAGGAAGTAPAQTRTTGGPAAGPVTTPPAQGGDPKVMLKEGRRALAEGRFNDAQDLARRAEASNPSGRWGLFDDTPASLLKDVQAAAAKAQKAEAERLVKQARVLVNKQAGSEAERAGNLDSALQMARRADQLHGPYTVWDLGDRPDKMVKEIESARAKLRTLPPPPASATAGVPGTGGAFTAAAKPATPGANTGVRPAVGTTMPAAPSGVVTATGTHTPGATPPVVPAGQTAPARGTAPGAPTVTTAPVAGATDVKKAAALKLMAEGKQCADRGDFGGAHAKYTEAVKAGAAFGPAETTPGFALQELNARGAAAIDRLLKEAQANSAKKDYAKAEAALTAAGEIAAGLGLFSRPIDDAKTALRMASGGQYGNTGAGSLTAGSTDTMPLGLAPVSPEPVKPVAPVASESKPAAPVPTAPAPLPVAVKSPAPEPTGKVSGKRLLDSAAVEYRKGDLDTAERIAREAFNAGSQAEATQLLKQIDADRLNMKRATAAKSFEAAAAAARSKDHRHALGVLVLIEPRLLTKEMAAQRDELIAACQAELGKTGGKGDAGVTATGGTQPPAGELQGVPGVTTPPGTATLGGGKLTPPKPAGPDSLATQADAMRNVTFQKLRGEGQKVQSDAQAAFGRGETDAAIGMLVEYSNRVRAAELSSAQTALLLRPVDARLEMFRVMKGQTDAVARVNKERNDAKAIIKERGAAEEQRKTEIARLFRQCHQLVKDANYVQAERVALQAKQLDPDDPAIGALVHMVQMTRRVKEYEKIKNDKDEMVRIGLNNAEKEGPPLDITNPVEIAIARSRLARARGAGDDSYLRSRTPKEFEIELKLDQPISVEFNQTPLSEVVENLRTMTGLPFSWDTDALGEERVSTAIPISEKLPGVSARNALHLILDKAKLSYVIEYDAVRITTQKKAKGRLVTKVFSVADLVTPIPNFALPDYANFEKMLQQNVRTNPKAHIAGFNDGPVAGPRNGLGGGTPAGSSATMPGIAGGTVWDPNSRRGGTLENNPIAASSSVAPGSDRSTKHEQLIKMVTSMVRPYSWDGPHGGPGKIEYFDIGSALVVNQTADVIREISDLLEALRRLQDLAVAVEVRIISLSETFYERMGVDFSVNVQSHQTAFEPNLAVGQFRPEPYLNSLNGYKGIVTGLTPAGTFTPDLNVPIRATSFQRAIPDFGGYPNAPGNNGGVSLGLAFLNDVQVYMFMEAAQGNRRVNVMQAPKLTLFNGQTATITVSQQQFFVSDVQVFSVNGQIVFIPNNTIFPGAGNNVNVSLQAVVSADRRFVRMNLPITLAAQTGATVPLFPVTTFITPVFEGGSQGVPIPFTQFLQQPSFTTMNIQTTVVCPDGGTVLLGGLKTLSEGRNEYGPPFLSKIPYLNRLFKNVGIGRETQHVMIMVTPRIIINSEEEINQTEGAPLGTSAQSR